MLRASGPTFSADVFLAQNSLPGAEARGSDLAFAVSERDGDDLIGQLQDADEFLSRNAAAMRSLVAAAGAGGVVLDFGLWRTNRASQSIILPATLVAAAGALGIALQVSFYAASDF